MRVSFKAAHDHVKQTVEDIGFGMILPDQKRGEEVSDGQLFYPGTVLAVAGGLANSPEISLIGCLMLTILSHQWAARGKKIRRSLEMSKLFL